jgi:hypothetical protein
MNNGFSEIGAFQENGNEVKHYYFEDYHLWVWTDPSKDVVKFEFTYKNWRVKYSGGQFSPGSENYIMPVFFIIEQEFGADPICKSKLLDIRDSYSLSLNLPIHHPQAGIADRV